MFKGTRLKALELDQDPNLSLNNQMGALDGAYIQKYYAFLQGKDDETVTILSRSHQVRSKFRY